MARLQPICLPEPSQVHRAACSRAGLVVVAQLGEQHGIFSICSLIDMPKPRLEVLRQMRTGPFVQACSRSTP